MKNLLVTLVCMCIVPLSNMAAADNERTRKQAKLDAACEAAREKKLAPLRRQYIQECVDKQKKDKAHCERFYSDYGARSGDRAPLFYDLPECVTAFEYKRSYRRAD